MKALLLVSFLLLILTACTKNDLPVACFNYYTTDNLNGFVKFNNCSENAMDYSWDFGDGSTSTTPEPTHQFEPNFPLTVTLIAFNENGTDTLIVNISEEQLEFKPNAKFTYSLLEPDYKTVKFTNTSFYALQFKWDFGDETNSTEENPTHTFSSFGTYTITLQASKRTETDTYEQQIEVIDSFHVVPDFYYHFNDFELEGANFFNTTKWGKEYLWDFGDGTTSTMKEPYHVFPKFSTYKVKLTAKNNYTTETVTKEVKVLAMEYAVVVDFDFEEDSDDPYTFVFTNKSWGATRFVWNFNNEGTSTNENPTYTFSSTNFELPIVTLEAWNESGGYGKIEKCISRECNSVGKPNIYLYPEKPMQVQLKIDFPMGGKVTKSVPEYSNGWDVYAEPDGRINYCYNYLFYESSQVNNFQKEKGWCIAKEDLEAFFKSNMAMYKFNEDEIDDFVKYWVPRLNFSAYFNIYPQTNREIDEAIVLTFSTQPDNIIRLFYGIYPTDNIKALPVPSIPNFHREGFVVTEWGVFQD